MDDLSWSLENKEKNWISPVRPKESFTFPIPLRRKSGILGCYRGQELTKSSNFGYVWQGMCEWVRGFVWCNAGLVTAILLFSKI